MHCGPSGAGHFVKMIHNGIEYGLMQAYAEGFDILRGAAGEERAGGPALRPRSADIAEVWRRGSVIGSWLLDLTAMALAEDPQAGGLFGALSRIPAKAAGPSWRRSRKRCRRMSSRRRSMPASARARRHSFADKLLSAMRNGFGGHVEPEERHLTRRPADLMRERQRRRQPAPLHPRDLRRRRAI